MLQCGRTCQPRWEGSAAHSVLRTLGYDALDVVECLLIQAKPSNIGSKMSLILWLALLLGSDAAECPTRSLRRLVIQQGGPNYY